MAVNGGTLCWQLLLLVMAWVNLLNCTTCTLEYQVFNESNCRFVLKGLAKNLEMKMKHGVMPKQTLSLKLYSDVLEDDMYIEQLVTVK